MIKDPSNTIIKIKKIKKSDRVKKIKETISTTQNKNALFKNSSILWKSIKQNGIFWITSVISVFVLTFYNSKNNSYINAYITFFDSNATWMVYSLFVTRV